MGESAGAAAKFSPSSPVAHTVADNVAGTLRRSSLLPRDAASARCGWWVTRTRPCRTSRVYRTEYIRDKSRISEADQLGVVASLMPLLARARNLCLQGRGAITVHRGRITGLVGAVMESLRPLVSGPEAGARHVSAVKSALGRMRLLLSDISVFGEVKISGVWFTRWVSVRVCVAYLCCVLAHARCCG